MQAEGLNNFGFKIDLYECYVDRGNDRRDLAMLMNGMYRVISIWKIAKKRCNLRDTAFDIRSPYAIY